MRAGRLLILAGFLLAIGWCSLPDRTQRWRITIEIETPAGLRSGAGVVETNERDGIEVGAQMYNRDRWVRGEAIPVDLPGTTLFALVGRDQWGVTRSPEDCYRAQFTAAQRAGGISPSTPFTIAQRTAERACRTRRERFRADARQAIEAGRPFVLDPEYWPRLVRFADPANRASISELDPQALAGSLGPGFRVRRVTVEPVGAAITTGIETRLPWLAGSANGPLDFPIPDLERRHFRAGLD